MNITWYQNEESPINSLWRRGRKCLLSSQQSLDSSQWITSAETFVFLTSASKHEVVIIQIALAVTGLMRCFKQLFLLAYTQLDQLFMLLHEIHLWVSSRIMSQVRLWNSSPFAEAWLFCLKNIKFLSIERWSLISIWRGSGKLSVLPSSKGVLISYRCEPEQYGHINEGLVIVPMIIYMSKH